VTWFHRFCAGLGRDDLTSLDAPVPFSVQAETPIVWTASTVEQAGDRSWTLHALADRGIEARWNVREYSDTGAIECSGQISNRSRSTLPTVRELWTLDLPVGLTEAWGDPWVRTVNGVRFCPNFFPPDDFRVVDRQLIRTPQVFTPVGSASLKDGRSSGRHLPCAVLSSEKGDRGLGLFYEWSGLWSLGFMQDATSHGREGWPWRLHITAGIWGLSLDLHPGETLPLPNLLIVGFAGDLETGCNALRRHVREHIAPRLAGENALPPTSFNQFFAFGNVFTADLLKPAVTAAAAAGLEYFVVDGGWFPGGFRKGIGNWTDPDSHKFPSGIAAFSEYVVGEGIKFGLWFEPEFAHIESEIYREHPDWFLTGPHTSPWSSPTDVHYADGVRMIEDDDLGERFALADFGLAEVQQWWIERIVQAYHEWNVRWIRWDFNQAPRPYWDNDSQAGAVGLHQIKHIEGLYRTLDEILAACPDLFIEQCASGGYRIDLGTIRRGHAFWMNDHTTQTDVVRALQHGLNTVLPGIYANTNLCQGRFDYTDYDYLSHGAGSFGYSGALWQAPRPDFERYRNAVTRFKTYRHLLGEPYSRPTGNPDGRFEHAHVIWGDGSQTLEMEFNHNGPGTAELRLG